MRFALFAALFAAQVPEPPAGGAIDWQAPAGCPDRLALEDAIVGRLGREPGADELALRGRVERVDAARYRLDLRLTVDGHTQTRRLSTRRCAALVDAAALLVALALDPTARPGELEGLASPELEPLPGDLEVGLEPSPVEPDAPPEPGVDAPAAAPADADVPAAAPADAEAAVEPLAAARVDAGAAASPLAPAPAPRRGPGGLVRVGGGLEVGAVPGPTAAVELALGLLWRRARLELHGAYLAPQTAARGDNAVRVDLLAAGARGCARLGPGRLEFPLCGGLELGGLRGAGSGPGARAGVGLWAAARASVGAVWRFHRLLGLHLAVEGLARLAAPAFDLRDPGPQVRLFSGAPVSLRVLLGLEVRLGDPR